ncbi:Uncharacterized small protein, DUF1192 family [Sphingomonas sp. OK281]|nr:Uncharacterized small protein, DUF1192 family [Sphingomonas sp. OK281]
MRVNVTDLMELEDTPSRPDDLLDALVRQDLDPLSVAELDARITVLQGEIARCQLKKDRAVSHRASADDLFRR